MKLLSERADLDLDLDFLLDLDLDLDFDFDLIFLKPLGFLDFFDYLIFLGVFVTSLGGSLKKVETVWI